MSQLILHLIGDYLLQSDWMALNKTKMDATPILFAINAGESLHNIVSLPITSLPNFIIKFVTCCPVKLVGIISNNSRYLGGLKK